MANKRAVCLSPILLFTTKQNTRCRIKHTNLCHFLRQPIIIFTKFATNKQPFSPNVTPHLFENVQGMGTKRLAMKHRTTIENKLRPQTACNL